MAAEPAEHSFSLLASLRDLYLGDPRVDGMYPRDAKNRKEMSSTAACADFFCENMAAGDDARTNTNREHVVRFIARYLATMERVPHVPAYPGTIMFTRRRHGPMTIPSLAVAFSPEYLLSPTHSKAIDDIERLKGIHFFVKGLILLPHSLLEVQEVSFCVFVSWIVVFL